MRQFASLVYVSGTAGGALLQRSTIKARDCAIDQNSADVDAGALLLQQPAAVEVSRSSFMSNTAHQGVGGGLVVRGTGRTAAVGFRECQFRGNLAAQGSGGALLIDSGLGVVELSCEECDFDDNDAGQVGGHARVIVASFSLLQSDALLYSASACSCPPCYCANVY